MIVILGPIPCHTCGTPVTVVRRDVEQPCSGPDCLCLTDGPEVARYDCPPDHTHTLPDVGPFTPVDEDGTRHECGR